MSKQGKIKANAAVDVIEYIALDNLYLSDMNPRQNVSDEGISLLAESIVTCGLIQNLAGLRDTDGKVAIVAGGRRLRALQIAVAKRDDLRAVPVRLAPTADIAQEWANAENTAREALDPVDEVRAYGKMAAKGSDVARIAQAFGVTEAHVYRRLALSGLPDPVLDAVKAGDLSMGLAKAMTVSSDEEKILEVLDRCSKGWINEYQIKTMLKPDAVDSTNRKAKFVGIEAYKEAGGTVTHDLFEDEVMFDNPDILERLFAEKLEDAANALQEKEGWAWVQTHEENVQWYELQRDHGFGRVYREEGELDETQAERYDELAELAENEALDEAGQAEFEALEAILTGEYTDAQKQIAGAIILVGYRGDVEIIPGLIKREDQPAAIDAGILAKTAHSDTGDVAGSDKSKPAYSQKFVDDMKAIRLAAVQTALLEKPEFVLDLLAFSLSPASGYGSRVVGLRLDPERNAPEIEGAFNLSSRLGGEMTDEEFAAHDQLEQRSYGGLQEAFKAFRAQGKKCRNAQITENFARAILTQKSDFMAEIEAEAGADIRSIWTPTDGNCFKRLNGAQLDALFMSLLDLTADSEPYRFFVKTKKGAKVEAMHKLFNDAEHQKACGVTPAQKARIDAWVPECFDQ